MWFLFQSHFDSLTLSPNEGQQQQMLDQKTAHAAGNDDHRQTFSGHRYPRIGTCISCPVLFNDTVRIPASCSNPSCTPEDAKFFATGGGQELCIFCFDLAYIEHVPRLWPGLVWCLWLGLVGCNPLSPIGLACKTAGYHRSNQFCCTWNVGHRNAFG